MFILIVVLMSIALVGIIAVQVFWIKDALKNKQQEFRSDVIVALIETSDQIKEREYKEFRHKYDKFFENTKFRTDAEMKNYLFQQIDTVSKQKFTFGATILEENFKIPVDFVNSDSVLVKRFTGKEDIFISKIIKSKNKDIKNFTDENRFSIYKAYPKWQRQQIEDLFSQVKRFTPIHRRVTSRELNKLLKEEFAKRNIRQEFKFGVYEGALATPIKSGYFKIDESKDYSYPLLEDDEGNSNYKLYVSFPDERQSLLSGILQILVLSLLFIGIIIAAFSTSLYQIIQQKKISEIKSDFINNMTHEFKTPIATINLALDAIKNPKIINDKDKIMRYIKMIRDENKRMHGQVENVLRISKLEKNQIEITKDTVDIQDIIEEAIEHVILLVSDKGGEINMHFQAISTEVLGNQFHLINVVINMLENAIKYSDNAPKIDVFTESTSKYFIFKIKDEGIGMSKNAQKYVFDKFYREHSGNIHNVKGHGLGLAYVKEIVDNHHGVVLVSSEKNKGSIFTVKLPLI